MAFSGPRHISIKQGKLGYWPSKVVCVTRGVDKLSTSLSRLVEVKHNLVRKWETIKVATICPKWREKENNRKFILQEENLTRR